MKRALLAMLVSSVAFANPDPKTPDAQRAQIEAVRAEIAAQIQLQAYDLIDELVFEWLQNPPFGVATPLVLADVGVPVSFGSGLQALIENHLTSVVLKNPRSNVVLTHCPACTAMVVHSGAKGTVVSRGVDSPEALAEAGTAAQSKHALFLDFEVEGSAMVLRVRITSLEPSLPIVYAKTLTTSTGSAALLRTGDRLKSAADARKEYTDILENRSTWTIPIKVGVKTYPPGFQSIPAPPFIWISGGVEAGFNQARAWLASFSVGVSWAPQSHTAWSAQARVARLLTGTVSSLTHPDLYFFLGASIVSVYGNSALLFSDDDVSIDELTRIITNNPNQTPSRTFGAFQIGLELRVKNRIGVGVYLETIPALASDRNIGNYLNLGLLRFQTFGAEVSFCF